MAKEGDKVKIINEPSSSTEFHDDVSNRSSSSTEDNSQGEITEIKNLKVFLL